MRLTQYFVAAVTALLFWATPANAQTISLEHLFQGPYNQFDMTQRVSRAGRYQVSRGAPHPNLRCGYWLMQKYGLSDRRLWRAYAWSSVGRPSNGSVGDIAVMKRSHVGYVSGHCGGGVMLTSYGNSRIGVFTKCYPRSAFRSFRRL